MEIVLCSCNWNIPGVEALPHHYHPASPRDTYEPGSVIDNGPFKGLRHPRLVRDPDQEPHFSVDWKRLYRALATSS